MADKKWMQGAIKKPGAFTVWCKQQGYGGVTDACINKGMHSKNATIKHRASLAKTFKKMARKRK